MTPHWEVTAAEAVPPLDTLCDTDVAIIGAGYTGLSTALHAAQHGLDCLVLEARDVGFGGSGRNVGLLNAGLWLPPDVAQARLGPARARLMQDLSAAPAFVMDLITRHQIRCDLTRSGTLHAAHSAAGFRDLQARYDGWVRRGAPVHLLDKADAAEKIGTDRFYGALLDDRAGTLNPLSYARGLARAARGAGAKIVSRCPVNRLEPSVQGWRIQTGQGVVNAHRVVLAANAYNETLWPGLRESFAAIHLFQIATEPLGTRIKNILPDRQGVWDTAPIMFYFRRDVDDRLVLGSFGRAGPNTENWAARQLHRMFPNLGQVSFGQPWDGRVAFTPDHLPAIYALAPGLYAPMAYNGRGIAPGSWFGKVMADYLYTGDPDTLPLPLTKPRRVSLRRLRETAYATAFAVNTAWQRL